MNETLILAKFMNPYEYAIAFAARRNKILIGNLIINANFR